MSNRRAETFVGRVVPGHVEIVTVNDSDRAMSLRCEECGEHLGRFKPGRWREKQMDEAWERHAPTDLAGLLKESLEQAR